MHLTVSLWTIVQGRDQRVDYIPYSKVPLSLYLNHFGTYTGGRRERGDDTLNPNRKFNASPP